MKIRLVIICSLFLSGCGIFDTLFMAVKELVPLAIKYAPYLLLFAEDSDPTLENADKQQLAFQNYLRKELQKNPENIKNLLPALKNQIDSNKNLKAVYFINLQNCDADKLNNLYKTLSQQGKIKYRVVNYTEEQSEEFYSFAEHCQIPFCHVAENVEVK